MPHLRRLANALAALLLLQLTLLGSGTPCAAHEGGAGRGAHAVHGAQAGMAGMAHAMLASASHDHGGSAPAPAGCDGSSSEDCRLPWAPGQCASMTTCAQAPAAAVVAADVGAPLSAASELPEPGLLRSRPAAAPELPPPRA